MKHLVKGVMTGVPGDAGKPGLAAPMDSLPAYRSASARGAAGTVNEGYVDPPVSEAQRGAMYAAAAGKSNIGIPAKVGREYVKSDKGGKLPKRK